MPQARTSHAMNKSDASGHPCLCSTLWESIQSFTTKYNIILNFLWASLVAQTIKTPPAMRETWVWSLGWEDPLEEVMETQVSLIAGGVWRIPVDRGALWATVHGVTKNQTQCSLSSWRSSSLFKRFFLPWTNIEFCQMPFFINQYVFFFSLLWGGLHWQIFGILNQLCIYGLSLI